MAQARFFSSTAQPTTLTSSISNTTTSIPLAATTGFPVQFPYTIALDYGNSLEELCDVTSVAGLNANVTRAVDGTTAASHSVGAPVRHVSSARDFNGFYIHIGSSAGVHGVTGNVVGDTDTQTLTNKTLTSPTINGTVAGSPTFSGTPAFSGGTITGAWNANATFQANVNTNVPFTIKGAASQNANLLNVQSSGAFNFLQVTQFGQTILTPVDNGHTPLIVSANTGQTVDLADFQVNGVTLTSVKSDGAVSIAPTGISAGEKYLQVNSPASAATNNQLINLSANGTQVFDVDVLGKSLLSPIDTTAADLWKVNSGASTNSNAFLMRLQNNSVDAFTVNASAVVTLNNGIFNITPSNSLGNAVNINAPSGYTANFLQLLVNSVNKLTIDQNGNVVGGNITNGTAYTPSITGGALTLGNGTIVGRSVVAGGMTHVDILITMGSTSTLAASGNLTVSLPSTANSAVSSFHASYYTKTSGGAFQAGSIVVAPSANTATFNILNGVQYLSFNTTNGGAIAAGSVVVLSATYLN